MYNCTLYTQRNLPIEPTTFVLFPED